MKMKDAKTKDGVLEFLRLCRNAFNKIPNTKLSYDDMDYTTYELASHISSVIKSLEDDTLCPPPKQIEVFAFISGGVLQGVSASTEIDFTLFDKDNWDQETEEEQAERPFRTPEEWDNMITERTKKGELVPIH